MKSSKITRLALSAIDEAYKNQLSDERIANITDSLNHVSVGGFECRLGDHQSGIDFSLLVTVTDVPVYNPIYREIHAALTDYRDDIHAVWLEYDTSKDTFNKQPGVFIPLKFIHRKLTQDYHGNYHLLKSILNSLLYRLSRRYLHSAEINTLIEAILDLPIDGYPAYVGLMISRSSTLKLSLTLLNYQELPNYLERIGITATSELAKKLKFYTKASDYLGVDVNYIGGELQTTFGVECFISKDDKARELECWKKYLLNLARDGLCNEHEVYKILQWHNRSSAKFQNYFQRISHIKLVCDSHNILHAKAYLGYGVK